MSLESYEEKIAYAETQDQMERLRERTLDSPNLRSNLLVADEVAMRWAYQRLKAFEDATRDLLADFCPTGDCARIDRQHAAADKLRALLDGGAK